MCALGLWISAITIAHFSGFKNYHISGILLKVHYWYTVRSNCIAVRFITHLLILKSILWFQLPHFWYYIYIYIIGCVRLQLCRNIFVWSLKTLIYKTSLDMCAGLCAYRDSNCFATCSLEKALSLHKRVAEWNQKLH